MIRRLVLSTCHAHVPLASSRGSKVTPGGWLCAPAVVWEAEPLDGVRVAREVDVGLGEVPSSEA